MALGWLALLKTVPWVDVIGAAPGVASGAKKLWDAVGNRTHPPAVAPEGGDTVASLAARTLNLEADLHELQGQLVTASKLISSLAEQNASLIAQVNANRSHVRWLTAAALLSAGLASACLILVLVRT